MYYSSSEMLCSTCKIQDRYSCPTILKKHTCNKWEYCTCHGTYILEIQCNLGQCKSHQYWLEFHKSDQIDVESQHIKCASNDTMHASRTRTECKASIENNIVVVTHALRKYNHDSKHASSVEQSA